MPAEGLAAAQRKAQEQRTFKFSQGKLAYSYWPVRLRTLPSL